VPADAGIGGISAETGDQGELARGEISHGLGDHHPLARSEQHPLDDRRGIGQEVIEARLHDHDVRERQRLLGGSEVEQAGVDAATAQGPYEPFVEVEPDVGADTVMEAAQVEHPRAATQLEHLGAVRHLLGDHPQTVAVVATVEDAHQQLVAAGAAVHEARAHRRPTVPLSG
jgi:hypothetical protein